MTEKQFIEQITQGALEENDLIAYAKEVDSIQALIDDLCLIQYGHPVCGLYVSDQSDLDRIARAEGILCTRFKLSPLEAQEAQQPVSEDQQLSTKHFDTPKIDRAKLSQILTDLKRAGMIDKLTSSEQWLFVNGLSKQQGCKPILWKESQALLIYLVDQLWRRSDGGKEKLWSPMADCFRILDKKTGEIRSMTPGNCRSEYSSRTSGNAGAKSWYEKPEGSDQIDQILK